MSYTPGPWHLSKHGEAVLVYNNTGIGECAVAKTIGTANTLSQRKSNARLIAAAPDLLEALQGLGAMPGGYCFCFNSIRDSLKPDHEHTGECRAARAAIAKVEGNCARKIKR